MRTSKHLGLFKKKENCSSHSHTRNSSHAYSNLFQVSTNFKMLLLFFEIFRQDVTSFNKVACFELSNFDKTVNPLYKYCVIPCYFKQSYMSWIRKFKTLTCVTHCLLPRRPLISSRSNDMRIWNRSKSKMKREIRERDQTSKGEGKKRREGEEREIWKDRKER